MSNPREAILFAYGSREAAIADWAQLKDNDNLCVVGINIMSGFSPAKENVAWIILSNKAFLEHSDPKKLWEQQYEG